MCNEATGEQNSMRIGIAEARRLLKVIADAVKNGPLLSSLSDQPAFAATASSSFGCPRDDAVGPIREGQGNFGGLCQYAPPECSGANVAGLLAASAHIATCCVPACTSQLFERLKPNKAVQGTGQVSIRTAERFGFTPRRGT